MQSHCLSPANVDYSSFHLRSFEAGFLPPTSGAASLEMKITVWYLDADGKKRAYVGDVVAGSQQHIRAFTVLFPGDEEEYPVQKWSSVDDDPDFDEWQLGDYNTDPAAYERIRERVCRLVRVPMLETSRSDIAWGRLRAQSEARQGEPGYASGRGASNAKRPLAADDEYACSSRQRANDIGNAKRLKAEDDGYADSSTHRSNAKANDRRKEDTKRKYRLQRALAAKALRLAAEDRPLPEADPYVRAQFEGSGVILPV